MIPALAAVACPVAPSSTIVTSAPLRARANAAAAPAIPAPMTVTRADISSPLGSYRVLLRRTLCDWVRSDHALVAERLGDFLEAATGGETAVAKPRRRS